ncbi:hypothetical protein [Zunongwangia sp.]|uniref:hypothetical protein n=1 Tax=Zunongwangia sp. TaxID=1965325 RepID=UPI003AA9729C
MKNAIAIASEIDNQKEVENLEISSLKKAIWLYFFLLIFEGALRKWALPSLSAPLLIIRDPVALWIIYTAWRKEFLPYSPYLVVTIFITAFSLTFTMLIGHGNLGVGIYGARILVIHFPLLFIIGKVFNIKDVIAIGKIMLYLAIPMTILVALQFYSPQSAWVNRGVGGDMGGAGFSGAMGYFRPPGTFSFTTGNTMFYGLLAAFVFYFLIQNKKVNRILLILSVLSLLIAVPLSISRTLLFEVIISFVFACITAFLNGKYSRKIIGIFIILLFLLTIVSTTEVFQKGTEVFLTRIESASKFEGGMQGTLIDRYLGGMVNAVGGSASQDLPFFGYGLGMGTNVGSMLLTGGRTFLIAEEEWGRLIGEMGILFGLSIIFIRVTICISWLFKAYRNVLEGNLLAWMLLSFGLVIIPQGQWAQPTALGFGVLVGGLILASFNTLNEEEV